MKKKRNLYVIALFCFITLVGVTIAYLQSTDTFENIFNAGTYSVITHEEFISPTNWKPGDTTPKTITTTNEGTIPVMVRVKFDESWTSSNDEVLPLTIEHYINDYEYFDDPVSIINLDNEEDWVYKNGYYYYLYELLPGESTSSLIESVTFNPYYSGVFCSYNSTTNSNECTTGEYSYMGGHYKLDITIETVQADRYRDVWDSYLIMFDYVGDNPCTYNGELVEGAEYVNGQYTYQYRREWGYDDNIYADNWINISDFGWGVRLTDSESTNPVNTTLCSSINNKPIVSMSKMFSESQATILGLSSFDTSNVTNMTGMFFDTQATSLDLSSFDTSNVIYMAGMFSSSQATTLDLSSFDTSNVTDMGWMFSDSGATSINLSSFDTSNVTNMEGMFAGSQATTLNLSNFDTSRVTSMYDMFSDCCATSIDLSSFDTSKVTDMSNMFKGSHATTLNLSSFNTSKVFTMSSMFYGSQATTLILTSFDTSKVRNMWSMFYDSRATVLDLSSFDINENTNLFSMFHLCSATTGYAKTQADADRLNNSYGIEGTGLTFVVKNS